MAEIHHRLVIRAPIERVYEALTTVEGLRRWWTTDVNGAPDEAGAVVQFRFGTMGPDMRVEALTRPTRVEWLCVNHARQAEEWIGTRFAFALSEANGAVVVRFQQSGWRGASDFLAHCSTKWATFLLSLRESVETGAGRPFPYDLQIA